MKLPLIAHLDLFSHALPLIAALYKWRPVSRNRSGAAFFFAFTALGALTEGVTYWMATHHIRNLWMLHFHNLGQYILLMSMFSLWQEKVTDIKESEKGSSLFFLTPAFLRWSIFVYTAFWLVSKWTFEKWNEPASYTVTVSTLVFIVISLATLYRVLIRLGGTGESMLRNFQFWVTVGVLMYSAGSAVHFLLIPLSTNLAIGSAVTLWSIHWGLNVLVNVLYAYGLLCLMRQQTA